MKNLLIAIGLLAACSSFAWATDQGPTKSEKPQRTEKGQRWKATDTDKDGALSKQEAEAAKMQGLVNHFDKIDSNKDGKVTHEEMRTARHQRAAKHEHMKKDGMMHPAPGKPAEAPKY